MTPEIALTCLYNARDFNQFCRLRAALPETFRKDTCSLGHFVRMFRAWSCNMVATLFYDRLAQPAWQQRITFLGTPPQRLFEPGQPPVIFVFLHTGSFPILRFWLRAQRLPVALYLGIPPRVMHHSRKLRECADRAYGLEGLPDLFAGGKSLRDAVRFLQPGRALLVALEERDFRDAPQAYPANGVSICLSRLAFRVALLSGATLVPVSVRDCGPFRFEITLGPPVPATMINEGGLAEANQHLLNALWPGVEADPSSLTWTPLEALSPGLKQKRGTWP